MRSSPNNVSRMHAACMRYYTGYYVVMEADLVVEEGRPTFLRNPNILEKSLSISSTGRRRKKYLTAAAAVVVANMTEACRILNSFFTAAVST